MKTLSRHIIIILIITFAFTSCKKTNKMAPVVPIGPLGPNYPYALNNVVTPAIIDTLEKHGMKINPGLTPPSVNGIYLISPNFCTFDDSGNNLSGTVFDPIKFKFSNQKNSAFTISLAYNEGSGEEVGSDTSATFISGSDSLFTIYAFAKDTISGITSTNLTVVSGTFATAGINNFQEAYILLSKAPDPTNILIPVGSIRLFEDEDGFSETQTTFSIIGKQVQSIF